jgi:trehalose 6-phosphate phosphatase
VADFAALARIAGRAGLFCDFDGSLAPIVDRPSDARALPGAGALLTRLSRRYAVVAVVSGRAVRDLASRFRAPGVRYVGLHGMEELRDGRVLVVPAAAAAMDRVSAAAEELRGAFRGMRGVMVEHKGLAIAVHFRRAPDPDEAEAIAAPIVGEVAVTHTLAVVPGRRVLELKPPAAGNKGDAVRRIVAEHALRGALFAGDDVGDLPAFSALDGLEVAIRVAVASAESPPELSALADVVVAGPADVLRLLRTL